MKTDIFTALNLLRDKLSSQSCSFYEDTSSQCCYDINKETMLLLRSQVVFKKSFDDSHWFYGLPFYICRLFKILSSSIGVCHWHRTILKDKLEITYKASIHEITSSAEAFYCAWILYLDYLYLDSLDYLLYLEEEI